jgi:hypothetical protein
VLSIAGLIFLNGVFAFRPVFASLAPPAVFGKDFQQEYVLARAIVDRVNPYRSYSTLAARYVGTPVDSTNSLPTPHPPTAGLLALPFSFLSYQAAAAAWLVLELACLPVLVWLLGRSQGIRLSVWSSAFAAVALIGWYPIAADLYHGQLTVVQLLLLASACVAVGAGRQRAAGIFLALATLVKPFLWPLLLLVMLRREWRIALSAAATAGVLLGLTVAATGLDSLTLYVTEALPAVTAAYKGFVYNVSLFSLAWRALAGTGSPTVPGVVVPPLVEAPALARIASTLIPATVLILACAWARHLRSLSASLGFMVSISILVSPISWTHYFALLLIPIVQILSWLNRHHVPVREKNMLLIIVILLLPPQDYWTLLVISLGQVAGLGSNSLEAFAIIIPQLACAGVIGVLGLWSAVLADQEGHQASFAQDRT